MSLVLFITSRWCQLTISVSISKCYCLFDHTNNKWNYSSLLFGPPSDRADNNLGHKAELQTSFLYAAIVMVVRYGKYATKWTLLYAILDSFLRASVFVLICIRGGWNEKDSIELRARTSIFNKRRLLFPILLHARRNALSSTFQSRWHWKSKLQSTTIEMNLKKFLELFHSDENSVTAMFRFELIREEPNKILLLLGTGRLWWK